MILPNETIEKIKADAERYAGLMVWVNQSAEPDGPIFHEYISAKSYEAGATEWAKRAEEHLIPALEWIKKYGPCDALTVKFIDNAIAKYKEVSNG